MNFEYETKKNESENTENTENIETPQEELIQTKNISYCDFNISENEDENDIDDI